MSLFALPTELKSTSRDVTRFYYEIDEANTHVDALNAKTVNMHTFKIMKDGTSFCKLRVQGKRAIIGIHNNVFAPPIAQYNRAKNATYVPVEGTNLKNWAWEIRNEVVQVVGWKSSLDTQTQQL